MTTMARRDVEHVTEPEKNVFSHWQRGMQMLSKEQLEKIANPGPVDIGGTQNPIVTEMATELLSLREQMEALKNGKPDFFLLKTPYQDAWGDTCDLRCYEDELDSKAAKDDFGGVIIPLFTAAKPAEE